MRRMILLVSAILLCLCGCMGDGAESETTATPETTVPEVPALTVVADGASEYKVVRGDAADAVEINAAVRLSQAIGEVTGVSVPPASDWVKHAADIPADAAEILVGVTNRAESVEAGRGLGVDDYVIVVVGRRVVIRGGSSAATAAAVEAFIARHLDGETLLLAGDLREESVGHYAATLTLDGRAIGESAIMIPQGADRYCRYAAALLRDAIAEACGVVLEVKREGTDEALCLGSLRFAGEDSVALVRAVRAFTAAHLCDVAEGAVLELAGLEMPLAAVVPEKVHPTLAGKLPVALTDQKNATVAVVDLAAADVTAAEALLWEWKPTPVLGFNITGYANSVDEAKLCYDAAKDRHVVCVTSSAGFFGVAEYPSGEAIWCGSAKIGPHSIDLLPNGNVAVACSGNNDYDAGCIRVYAASQSKRADEYAEVKLRGAHGVVWDEDLGLLWGLGDSVICAYRIGGSDASPTIEEVELLRSSMPHGGGHDLSADPDAPGVFWIAGKDVMRFDARTGKFSTVYTGTAYKTFGNFPGGIRVQTQATGVYKAHDTDTLVWLLPDGAGKTVTNQAYFPTRAFYKARIWA